MLRWLARILVVVALLSPEGAVGQRSSASFPAAVAAQSGGGRTFLIEAAGGTAGSLLGFGIVYAFAKECDSEDLGCNLENAGFGILTGTIGSALGTYLAGKWAETAPSGIGAAIGATAGAAAGIGMWHLFTEELDLVNSPTAAVMSYAVTQGIVTALGSRIGRALK